MKNDETRTYPIPRDLDGIYVRMQRNGRWYSLCLSDLTEEELRGLKGKIRFELSSPEVIFHMVDTLMREVSFCYPVWERLINMYLKERSSAEAADPDDFESQAIALIRLVRRIGDFEDISSPGDEE